mmetsp:Transcript_38979/g.84843  ORF Transcript_38979/g.84843 Transcript_38979/m.84843 type:complete len:441 (-) Transcript_38979:74-1396(-)
MEFPVARHAPPRFLVSKGGASSSSSAPPPTATAGAAEFQEEASRDCFQEEEPAPGPSELDGRPPEANLSSWALPWASLRPVEERSPLQRVQARACRPRNSRRGRYEDLWGEDDFEWEESNGGIRVWLHVYDLGPVTGRLNEFVLRGANLGAFHCGIEVLGDEWAFQGFHDAWDDPTLSGVLRNEPRCHPAYLYRESVYLGKTPLDEDSVDEILDSFTDAWPANTYHLVTRNCVTFAEELAAALQVPEPFPTWVRGAIDVGKSPAIFHVADYGWSLYKWWSTRQAELEDGRRATAAEAAEAEAAAVEAAAREAAVHRYRAAEAEAAAAEEAEAHAAAADGQEASGEAESDMRAVVAQSAWAASLLKGSMQVLTTADGDEPESRKAKDTGDLVERMSTFAEDDEALPSSPLSTVAPAVPQESCDLREALQEAGKAPLYVGNV